MRIESTDNRIESRADSYSKFHKTWISFYLFTFFFHQQERKVLEIVTFPFIMSFVRSFKDSNYIYFLLEYVHGMELYHVIREIGS